MADARLSVKVSADAKEASAAFTALAADIKKVGTESVGVTDGVSRVDAAMKKLAGAADTPVALQRATAKLKLEMDELRATLEKTPASAEKMKAIAAALAQADSAIDKTVQRAGKLREANEEVAQKMGLTAKGAESLGGSFGSLEGIMGKMADSSSKTSQAIAKVGFSMLAVGTAFEFGYQKGKTVNQFIQEHGNYLEKLIDVQIRQIDGLGKLSDLYSGLPIKMNPVLKAHQANAAAAQSNAEKLKALGVTFTTLSAQTDTFTQRANAMNTALLLAQREGETWDSLLKVNEGSVKALAEEAVKLNIPLDKLPPLLQKAVADLTALQGAATGAVSGLDALGKALDGLGKGGTSESIEAVANALARIKAEGGDMGKAVSDNAAGLQKLRDAAEGSYETLDKFRKGIMDQIPAYQATALASAKYKDEIDGLIKSQEAYEKARSAANTADLEAGRVLAELRDQATQAAYAIDSIGDAWYKATGQAAGFSVEVRHATKAVEEADPEFTALIESLAGVSDEFTQMVPWVGALIKRLEDGQLSLPEFRAALEALSLEFMQVQGLSSQMFGPLESLFARLTALINDFTSGQRNPNIPKRRR